MKLEGRNKSNQKQEGPSALDEGLNREVQIVKVAERAHRNPTMRKQPDQPIKNQCGRSPKQAEPGLDTW